MLAGKKVACIIPARLNSTRFPKKMLSSIQGKPLLQWVWEAAKTVPYFDEVGFAIDSQEVADLIDSFQGKWWMTSVSCACGSDRLAELCATGVIKADVWVNWQGDEPFICKKMIDALLQSVSDGSDLWTLKKRIQKEEEVDSIHFAKVVCDYSNHALYFSRSPIPCYRDGACFEKKEIYKHVGLYAYTSEALKKIYTLKPCGLESAEQLEQLRFLYNGLKIKVHETDYEVFGIDLKEHLVKADALLSKSHKTG